MKTYETRPGDTPAIIAKEHLGDRDLWADVVVWNAQKCGFMGPHDWYRVGTILRLPEVEAMSAIDHDEIYLQPVCCVNEDVGRLWCEDDDTEYCEDGKRWTRYVRADIHEAAVAELEALRQERDGLRAFVASVAKQKPEKPDYWSACGQCESNISDAEDLIEAMAKEQSNGN